MHLPALDRSIPGLVSVLAFSANGSESAMNIVMSENQVIPFANKGAINSLGGKADGLYELHRIGLAIPDTFFIQNAKKDFSDSFLADLEKAYQLLSSQEVAVRSSAQNEDSSDHSFAGQYDTILNVTGFNDLKKAIERCISSLSSSRAISYQNHAHIQEDTLNIVVQSMVDPKAAGVVFTADPTSGRHDRIIVDAVSGLGESLVNGEVTPDHWLLDSNGNIITEQLSGEQPLLSAGELALIVKEAKQATIKFGAPLDLEWAIDQQGKVLWLQARPITTIGSDLNELDTPSDEDHIYTRCNIGEVMPSATTPLTLSIQGRGLEYGMQSTIVAIGGQPEVSNDWNNIHYSWGHLFINLTGSIEIARHSLIGNAKDTAQSICGQSIPELRLKGEKANLIKRIIGTCKFIRYALNADRVVSSFLQKSRAFYLPYQIGIKDLYDSIDSNLGWVNQANTVHIQSSVNAGAMEGVLRSTISRDKKLSEDQKIEKFAELSSGANWVESAAVGGMIDEVLIQISLDKDRSHFHSIDPAAARTWLESGASPSVKNAYRRFIEAHGHRSESEEMLEATGWSDSPDQLIVMLQARIRNDADIKGKSHPAKKPVEAPSLITRLVHNAIRRRECTKSQLIKILNEFKRAYTVLAERMTTEGLLEKPEMIFFMTHQELGMLISGSLDINPQCLRDRQKAYNFQKSLNFDDITIGKPAPIENIKLPDQTGTLSGLAVCNGTVTGRCRVAKTLQEASETLPGEILIAPATDVSWTPYFGSVSGLVTDVGSTVSHGAVIAREYDLPCIVNTRVATQYFVTGDLIELNASAGWVKKLEN